MQMRLGSTCNRIDSISVPLVRVRYYRFGVGHGHRVRCRAGEVVRGMIERTELSSLRRHPHDNAGEDSS